MKIYVFLLSHMASFFLVTSLFAYGGEVLSQMPCPVNEPMGMAVDGNYLWITDMFTRSIVKVQISDGKIVKKLEVPGFMPTGIALDKGKLFSADRMLKWIGRINIADDKDDLSPIPYYEHRASGMTYDGVHLWVVDSKKRKIHKIDPVDGTTIKTLDSPAKNPTGIAFDGRYLWVADHLKDEIYMMEREHGRVLSIIPSPGPYPSALAIVGRVLWVADYQERRLYSISLPDETPYIEENPRKVNASFDVLYRAKGSGIVKNLVAYVSVPQEMPGQHILSKIVFKPEPHRFVKDKWGQKTAVFELGNLKPGQLAQVGWEGKFALYQIRFHLDPDRIENSGIPKNMDMYLSDDKKYDTKSKVIKDLVQKLTLGKRGYYEKARAIYDHLSETDVITYDYSNGWNNAAAVLERGSGSCSEYSFALVALFRHAGIYARYVGALSERGNEASFDDIFHRWAEVYMPGYGWVPVDANAGYDKPPGERGSYFGGRSNRHVVTTIGGGSSEYLDWSYNSYETYATRDNATLEIVPIGRYRPLKEKNTVKPHEAGKVLAPLLTKKHPKADYVPLTQREVELSSEENNACPSNTCNNIWFAVIAVIISIGLGFAIGRFFK